MRSGSVHIWPMSSLRQRIPRAKDGEGALRPQQAGFYLYLVAMPALLFLSGCSLTFSPEQAAIQTVLESQVRPQPNPSTIRVLQSRPWRDGAVVLLTYQAVDQDGGISECLSMYETQRSMLGWIGGSGGGSCSPAGGDGQALGIGAGQHSGGDGIGLSHVTGLVHNEDISMVDVVWDDGERQQVEVVNGSYLALRAGAHMWAELQALNADGEVIYTHRNAPPAPGKESSTFMNERNMA
jgi:hypothetical protein